jgi:dimeric dUTPase (all-alpha-NTP-PPase superfamily)
MLEMIFRKQLALQTDHFGQNPSELEGEERRRYVNDMVLALTDELHEALAETPWKPWSQKQTFNRDAYINELVDALHFLVNLFLVADVDGYEIAERYERKNRVNQRRQQEGYDETNKCSTCRRALDDNINCTETECHADNNR